jgi:signal transduction histidine kinase
MLNAITQWFSTDGFMPHGHCYLWTPELLWTYIISDAAIGIAYYSIPLALLYLIRHRRQSQYNRMFALFSVFIFSCGTTHFFSIWTIWHPDYGLDASLKAITAIVSLATALALWPLIPKLVQAPTAQQLHEAIARLQHEVDEREKAEQALQHSEASLRELVAYQERIREDERKRIAREIHDELGQTLLALRLDVATLHERTGARHAQLQQRTSAALGYIDATMKSIRNIMNNLRPPVLDLGLQAAIEWQVRQFETRTGIPCELQVDDGGQQLPEAQAIAAFRILQESLNNIGRHARASFVQVKLRVDRGQLTMAIKDNGVGMRPGDRRKAQHFGLLGIQERVSMLDGELSIDSAPGRGTVLRLAIPLQAAPETGRESAAST